MLSIASESSDNGVLLTTEAVLGTFSIPLGLSGLVFGFALSVLLFARLLPGLGTRQVSDGLDNVALGGVKLTSGLAITEGRWPLVSLINGTMVIADSVLGLAVVVIVRHDDRKCEVVERRFM